MVFPIHWNESAMDLHVFPILIPSPTSLSTPSLWVFPVHQPRALVSCIQPKLAICFTVDKIHVLMLFSQIIPPSPSPIESESLFYTYLVLVSFGISPIPGWKDYHVTWPGRSLLIICLYPGGTEHRINQNPAWNLTRAPTRGGVVSPPTRFSSLKLILWESVSQHLPVVFLATMFCWRQKSLLRWAGSKDGGRDCVPWCASCVSEMWHPWTLT